MEDASGWNVRKDVNPFSVWTTSNKTSNTKASNDLTERVQQLEMELDVKQNDLTMAAEIGQTVLSSYHKLRDEYDQLTEILNATREESTQTGSQLKYWQLKFSELEKAHGEMEFKNFQMASQLQQLQQLSPSLRSPRNSHFGLQLSQRDDVEDLQRELESKIKSEHLAERRVAEMKKRLRDCEEDCQVQKTQLESCKTELVAVKNENQKLKSDFERFKSKSLAGVAVGNSKVNEDANLLMVVKELSEVNQRLKRQNGELEDMLADCRQELQELKHHQQDRQLSVDENEYYATGATTPVAVVADPRFSVFGELESAIKESFVSAVAVQPHPLSSTITNQQQQFSETDDDNGRESPMTPTPMVKKRSGGRSLERQNLSEASSPSRDQSESDLHQHRRKSRQLSSVSRTSFHEGSPSPMNHRHSHRLSSASGTGLHAATSLALETHILKRKLTVLTQISTTLLGRLSNTNTLNLNRRLKKQFDLPSLTQLSNSILDNITTDIQCIHSTIVQLETLSPSSAAASEAEVEDKSADEICDGFIQCLKLILTEVAQLRKSMNELGLAFYVKMEALSHAEVQQVESSRVAEQLKQELNLSSTPSLINRRQMSVSSSSGMPRSLSSLYFSKFRSTGAGAPENDEILASPTPHPQQKLKQSQQQWKRSNSNSELPSTPNLSSTSRNSLNMIKMSESESLEDLRPIFSTPFETPPPSRTATTLTHKSARKRYTNTPAAASSYSAGIGSTRGTSQRPQSSTVFYSSNNNSRSGLESPTSASSTYSTPQQSRRQSRINSQVFPDQPRDSCSLM